MNAHALAATTTAEPREPGTEAWVVHCAAVTLAWSALDQAIRSEVDA